MELRVRWWVNCEEHFRWLTVKLIRITWKKSLFWKEITVKIVQRVKIYEIWIMNIHQLFSHSFKKSIISSECRRIQKNCPIFEFCLFTWTNRQKNKIVSFRNVRQNIRGLQSSQIFFTSNCICGVLTYQHTTYMQI